MQNMTDDELIHHAGLPFVVLTSDETARLADLAERRGDELAQYRALLVRAADYLEGVPLGEDDEPEPVANDLLADIYGVIE